MGLKEGFPEEIIYKLESEGLIRFGGKDLQTKEIIMHEDLKEQGTTSQELGGGGGGGKDLLIKTKKTWSAAPNTFVLAVP